MTDPQIINLTKNVITKVATAVANGTIFLTSFSPSDFMVDYKLTGEAAPADLTKAIQCSDKVLEIQASAPIDVYLTLVNYNGHVVVSI